MNNIKKLLALLLAMVLVFGLCACGGGEDQPDNTDGSTEPSSTGETEESKTVDDGKVTYTVKVVDESGNPISGALVQLCLEACIPSATNDSGIATYNLEEADYKVSFMKLPDGYTYTTEATEFYFEDGSYELTITLKAAA